MYALDVAGGPIIIMGLLIILVIVVILVLLVLGALKIIRKIKSEVEESSIDDDKIDKNDIN